MKLLAFPAFKNKKSNPYNYMLYDGLDSIDCDVEEFSFKKALMLNYDVLHVHWPELFLNSNYFLKALLYSTLFLIVLAIAKLAGKKVVWTIHNLTPHSVKYSKLNSIFWFFYLKIVDGVISLSSANEKKAIDKFGFKSCLPKAVIYHGLYDNAYQNEISCEDARESLGLPIDSKVILFFGQIKPYKNVEKLISEFNKNNGNNYKLLIVGKFDTKEYFDEINNLIETDNIVVVNKFIPDEEIQIYYNAADLCVLPFKNIFNSGSALLSVTFNTSVLVPYTDNFKEYQEVLNEDCIKCYTGEITFEKISRSLVKSPDKLKILNTNLCEWAQIKKKHVQFYNTLIK